MPAAPPFSYDEVPYPKTTHRDTHIRRLESMATLLGMSPAPVDRCRILELGCASGWNLISQAREYPDSEFMGIDASNVQIDEAERAVAATGVHNVTFSQKDILTIDESLGRFDYIVCHGVYSWVREQVQAKILEVCRNNLKPQGVAMVSYNVYPGWHFRGLVREMMLFHTKGYKDTRARIGQARAALDFVVENTNQETSYGKILAEEMELLRKAEDTYLFHDHLEVDNYPLYFHEFIGRAQDKGLQYLCDVNFSAMMPHSLPEGARKALASVPLVQMEQYVDFLSNTSFRNTLLCHRDVQLQRHIKPQILEHFHVVLARKPVGFDLDPTSTGMARISFKNGSFRTNSPLVKAAFLELESSWPHALTLDELFERCGRLLQKSNLPRKILDTQTRPVLSVALLQTVLSGFVAVYVHQPSLCTTLSERPAVDPFVRLQARHGLRVTNLCHEIVALSEVARQVLVDLDGDHSLEDLAQNLKASIERGDLNLSTDGKQITSPTPAVVGSLLDHGLEQIRGALLLT